MTMMSAKQVIAGLRSKNKELKDQIKAVSAARDKLYDDLPTGDIDAFDLLKVVKSHITDLDAILGVEE